jgi:hypothetical protein
MQVRSPQASFYLGAGVSLNVAVMQADGVAEFIKLHAHDAFCVAKANYPAAPFDVAHHSVLAKRAQTHSVTQFKMSVRHCAPAKRYIAQCGYLSGTD